MDETAMLIVRKVREGLLPCYRPFSARDVYRMAWSGLTDSDVVKQALDELSRLGYLDVHHKQKTGGRPSVAYQWNPDKPELICAMAKSEDLHRLSAS